jgi:hypothetical protein
LSTIRKNLLARLLPDATDESFVCLRFIDPNQITTFNQRQMAPLIREIERVASNAAPEERKILDAVLDMASKGAAEPHLYLRFYGD